MDGEGGKLIFIRLQTSAFVGAANPWSLTDDSEQTTIVVDYLRQHLAWFTDPSRASAAQIVSFGHVLSTPPWNAWP